MGWTNSDNLHSRDALIVGGPAAGLRIPVRDQTGRIRYPDVVDLTGYVWDFETWQFVYDGVEINEA